MAWHRSVLTTWPSAMENLGDFADPFLNAIFAAMLNSIAWNWAALLALVPAALLPLRRTAERDGLYWGGLGLAIAGPFVWAVSRLGGTWRTNLSIDLWVGIAAIMVVFGAVVLVSRHAWRLTPLLLPYLVVLGLLASMFAYAPGTTVADGVSTAWIDLHILVSMINLALLTVAASAALGSFLQLRALKIKRPNTLTRMLPSAVYSERLFERLLLLSEFLFGLGVGSGLAMKNAQTGRAWSFDHTTLFSLIAFVLIGLLLIGRRVCGVRGQVAARVVLVAYMLVVLGFFGVKFVHQVILG